MSLPKVFQKLKDKANKTHVVNLSDDQEISGIKTFNDAVKSKKSSFATDDLVTAKYIKKKMSELGYVDGATAVEVKSAQIDVDETLANSKTYTISDYNPEDTLLLIHEGFILQKNVQYEISNDGVVTFGVDIPKDSTIDIISIHIDKLTGEISEDKKPSTLQIFNTQIVVDENLSNNKVYEISGYKEGDKLLIVHEGFVLQENRQYRLTNSTIMFLINLPVNSVIDITDIRTVALPDLSNMEEDDGEVIPVVTKYSMPSGRIAYRNADNTGTTVECTIGGAQVKYDVADAVYRSGKKWSTENGASGVPRYTTRGYSYINNDYSGATTTQCANFTDAQVDEYVTQRGLPLTYNAKETTDILINSASTYPAAEYCREVSLNNRICDLPTASILVRIYCDADFLDTLDPTAEAHPQLMLGANNTNGAWKINGYTHTWTCEEYTDNYAICMYFYGGINNTMKTSAKAVIPVAVHE